MAESALQFCPLTQANLDQYPVGCQGSQLEFSARAADLGAIAILALDGDRHIGQLQFRRYDPALRSPDSLWDPLYWGEFGEHAPVLPDNSLSLFCYHVGQIDDTEYRDPHYQGCGIGAALLGACLDWARAHDYAAVVAKASPSFRPVMAFMGGQSIEIYQQHGFHVHASWVDDGLHRVVTDKQLIDESPVPEAAATVSCCVLIL